MDGGDINDLTSLLMDINILNFCIIMVYLEWELNSSSYIESLWNSLKLLIKSTYKTIPQKNFLLFLKEAEWKFIIRSKNYDDKILEFLDIIKCVKSVGDDYKEDFDFLTNDDLNTIFNEDDSDSDNY